MARPTKTKTGDKHGLLTVTAQAPSRGRQSRWTCICECGNVTEVFGMHLRSNSIKSCGCQRLEAQRKAVTTHGLTKSPTHTTWSMMKQRCLNPRAPDFEKYGGRGVKVCERWLSFDSFLADMGPRPEGLTLDRIDNNRGYEPSNCRWATPTEQQANRRRTVFMTLGTETRPLAQLAKEHGLKPRNVYMRVRYGWTPEQALGIDPPP